MNHASVFNNTKARNLMYKLVKDDDYFITRRFIDFSDDLKQLADKYNDGYILFEYPIAHQTDHFHIFIESVSLVSGFDWKYLYHHDDGDNLMNDGYFLKDGTLTKVDKDAIDLQTFIRIHDMGFVTTSSDNSAYIINWTSKFSLEEVSNPFNISKWFDAIGLSKVNNTTVRNVDDEERIEKDKITIDSTFWIDIALDSINSSYHLYGDNSNHLLVGRLWLETGKGYNALYFAEFDVLKFAIRRYGPYLKVKLYHGKTGEHIHKPCYNRTVLDSIFEGRLLKPLPT